MEPLRLLTAPYETLSLSERAAALIAARRSGHEAASGPVSVRELESPEPTEYRLHVVSRALVAGAITDAEAEAWTQRCLGERALSEPRIQAFLFGWHERAVELLTELHATADQDDERLAKWFVHGLEP